MPRSFCIPGIVFLFCAFALSLLVSISLPYINTMDIVRVHSLGTVVGNGDVITEARFGIWAPCTYDIKGDRTCGPAGHGYSFGFKNPDDLTVIIGSSWTQGLAIHPVACVVTFIAFLMSFSQHITVTLMASLTAFLAATLMLIAFAVDIALYAFVHHELGNLPNVNEDTKTGPGFWLTFVSLILLLLGACTVCFGRRKDRMANSYPSYPMSTTKTGGFLSRFRRN